MKDWSKEQVVVLHSKDISDDGFILISHAKVQDKQAISENWIGLSSDAMLSYQLS